ncbi:hypothetical protein ACHQM5_012505 [Ranunculus cassubicifolius]
MGAEAENKPEEKKVEETKKEEEIKKPEEETKNTEEAKDETKKPEGDQEEKKAEEPKEPPPPEDIILKVFMHCEGCAKKVRRCLKGFDGVEDVQTDCKTSKVIVKGGKADPLKVLDRVQKKSHKQVELISPIPKPPVEGETKEENNKENVKPEEVKKKEEEVIITVVLKVHMHCEACAQEIQKRIMRMKGVKNAEADTKSSQVTVVGVFDPAKLVEYVYKRTGKHAMIVKTEPEKKEEEPEKAKEENAEKKEEGEKAKDDEKKEGGEGEAKPAEGGEAKPAEGEGEPTKVVEMKAHEYYYFPPPPVPKYYSMENYAYPPQIFSDENPNACSVM